jgi:hypothetical protein
MQKIEFEYRQMGGLLGGLLMRLELCEWIGVDLDELIGWEMELEGIKQQLTAIGKGWGLSPFDNHGNLKK